MDTFSEFFRAAFFLMGKNMSRTALRPCSALRAAVKGSCRPGTDIADPTPGSLVLGFRRLDLKYPEAG
jgi:hypothetical protein